MKNKEKMKNLQNDFKFINDNKHIIFAIMSYCIVLIWKGFDLVGKENTLRVDYFFFYSSLISALFCLMLLFLTIVTIALDKGYKFKKVLASTLFLTGAIYAVTSVAFLSIHVLSGIKKAQSQLYIVAIIFAIVSVVIIITNVFINRKLMK